MDPKELLGVRAADPHDTAPCRHGLGAGSAEGAGVFVHSLHFLSFKLSQNKKIF